MGKERTCAGAQQLDSNFVQRLLFSIDLSEEQIGLYITIDYEHIFFTSRITSKEKLFHLSRIAMRQWWWIHRFEYIYKKHLDRINDDDDNADKLVDSKCALCFVKYGEVEVGDESPAENSIMTKCGHHFGKNCQKTWLIKNCCPKCRAKLFPSPSSAAGDDKNIVDGIPNLLRESSHLL